MWPAAIWAVEGASGHSRRVQAVAAGVPPAVEGGILPSGPGHALSTTLGMQALGPPGGKNEHCLSGWLTRIFQVRMDALRLAEARSGARVFDPQHGQCQETG